MNDFKLSTNAIVVIITVVLSVGLIALLIASKGDEPKARERQLIDLAVGVGMEEEQFLTDYRSDEIRDKVAADIDYAEDTLERLSTPTVLFNGELANTPADYASFSADIEAALAVYEGEEAFQIEVFEDYQCPYCSQFFPMPYQAEAEFGDSIEVIHHNLPLTSIHPLAESYAWAAEAAKEQGKYVEMSTAIFEHQHGTFYQEMRDLGLVE